MWTYHTIDRLQESGAEEVALDDLHVRERVIVNQTNIGAASKATLCKRLREFLESMYLITTIMIIIIIAVIAIAPYLIDKGDHTALYKINKNMCKKTSKIIYKHNIVFLARARTDARTHPPPPPPTHTHIRARTCFAAQNWKRRT